MTPTIVGDSTEGNSASAYDLSALTSPGGAFSPTQGFVGSDWMYASSGGGSIRYKKDGNGQLALTVNLNGGSTGNNGLKNVTWNASDEIQGTTGGQSSPQSQTFNGVVGTCVQWSSIIADQRVRKFHWRGQTGDGFGNVGTWQVTAVLGDGSAVMAPFNLPAFACGFGITFAASSSTTNPTTLAVKIACTAAPDGVEYLFNQIAWLEVPANLVVPRGSKRFFLGRGVGGSLA